MSSFLLKRGQHIWGGLGKPPQRVLWEKDTLLALLKDIKAIYHNDPACYFLQVLLYPSLHAMLLHRLLARPLYVVRLRFLARLFSQINRFLTGIEIHPGAMIEGGLFIDHGMGVVIGETSRVGENCVMFHGVTLGGTGKDSGQRHPIIGDSVLIGTHATLLGPLRVGNNVKIGARTVVINRDIPDDCTVVGAPGQIVRRNGKRIKPPQALPMCVAHTKK